MDLFMIDNQGEKLEQLSGRLENEYGIRTRKLRIDLASPDAADRIMEGLKGLDCHLLVYNAAFSLVKPFTDHESGELDQFIAINARTQLKLVHAFSLHLIDQRKGGGIILMSSLAGLLGMQLVAPYAATKAFAWNLAEAIHHELKPYGIDVMACIAGATATPAYLKTNPRYGVLKPMVMKPDEVVDAALRRLGKKTLFMPGFMNRFNYFILTRILPRNVASRIANNTMKNMYSKK